MAEQLGKFLTELPEATSLKSDDLMYVVASNTSSKIGINNLKKSVSPIVEGAVNGDIASFTDGSDSPLEKCIAEITPKQAGSGTPSPTNVRAISGYTTVNVRVTGKNLCPTFIEPYSSASFGITYTLNSDGSVTLNGTSTGYFYIEKYTVLKAGSYIMSKGVTGRYPYFQIRNKQTDAWIASTGNSGSEATLILTEDTEVKCRFTVDEGQTVNSVTVFPMIRLATESEEYEPYNGNVYTTPLGQTVYGGQLNVLTGELTITHEIVDLGSLTYTLSTSGQLRATYTGVKEITGGQTNAICSTYEVWTGTLPDVFNQLDHIITVGNRNISTADIVVRESTITSATDTPTALNGIKVCYELATPITVQLTPQEVNSLLGQNNISADTGTIDVVYVRNLNIVINDLLERVAALENE